MNTQLPSTYRRYPYPWLLVLLLMLILSIASAHAVENPVPPTTASHTLQLDNGLLTVQVTDTPLRTVLAEVSHLSGVEIVWGTESGERLVSVDFTALPLDEGLRRVLERYNFMFVYATNDATSRLAQIWISSAIDAASTPNPSPPVIATPVAPESGEAWDEALGTFAHRDELAQSAAFVEEERKAMAGEEGE
jgi:hypothetical protein